MPVKNVFENLSIFVEDVDKNIAVCGGICCWLTQYEGIFVTY